MATVILIKSIRPSSNQIRASTFRSVRHVGKQYARRYSANASATATSSGAKKSPFAVFGSLTDQLDEIAPRFDIRADQIRILKEPSEFYETLKTKILTAQRRIFISTLYIGKYEGDLVDDIKLALRRNPQLKVSILTDALRGTREVPHPSCASLLVPLIQEFGDVRVQIRMFHTPNMTGIKKAVLPKRINEGWGLQHMKLYGIDDELIMSGANLSSDYFTNRQDRYHIFSSAAITSYFARVHEAVCDVSFQVIPEGLRSRPEKLAVGWVNPNVPSPLDDPRSYIAHTSKVFSQLIKPGVVASSETTSWTSWVFNDSLDGNDTTVYPLFQLTPLLTNFPSKSTTLRESSDASQPNQISTEVTALHLVLRALQKPPFFPRASWTFTAGYFNVPPQLQTLLIRSASSGYYQGTEQPGASGRVITAHPHANGFFNSAGISGMLPSAYTLFASRFMRSVSAAKVNENIKLYEWKKGMVGEEDGWTYHAKGLWITLPREVQPQITRGAVKEGQDVGPSITLVGSSNYTDRSATLDLEANALVLTTNNELRKRLKQEEEWLFKDAKKVEGVRELESGDRKVKWTVRVALWIVGLVGGKL